MLKKFKVLHISDLHFDGYYFQRKLSKKPFCKSNSDVTDTLSYSIRRSWADKLSAVLISGDLTCMGKDRDLDKAYKWVEDINSVVPTFLLPGNHDRYEFDVRAYPASIEFDNKFYNYWGRNSKVRAFNLPLRDRPELSIVCCDFTLKDKMDSDKVFGRYGQGKVYPDVLKLLEKTTNEEKQKGSAVLWMMHFSPEIRAPGLRKRYEILIDSNIMLSKAAKLGIKYIFCGHTHKKSLFNPKNFPDIEVHCSGTSGCIKKGHDTSIHFRDIYISSNNEIDHIKKDDYVWQNDRFVPV